MNELATAQRASLDLRPGLLVFIGPLLDIEPHRHPALALCFALEASLALPRLGCVRAFAVAADFSAPALPFGGKRTGIVFVQPDHPAYPALQARAVASGGLAPLPEEAAWLAVLRPADETAPLAAIDGLLRRGIPAAAPAADPRIRRVMELLVADVHRRYSHAALAEQVGLSASRLQHLFKVQTGTTPRRFRLWVRLRAAIDRLAHGDGLTQAAHMAGFSDSSHLTHTAREFFGLAPRHVVKAQPGVRVTSRGFA